MMFDVEVRIMPTRNDVSEKSEVLKVRISEGVRKKCTAARLKGAHAADAESTFLGYLVALGLARYERSILPIELGEDHFSLSSGREAASGE